MSRHLLRAGEKGRSERVAGTSKMTLRIALEGIRVTLALRRHHRAVGRTGVPMAL